jgi:hypothetical protein
LPLCFEHRELVGALQEVRVDNVPPQARILIEQVGDLDPLLLYRDLPASSRQIRLVASLQQMQEKLHESASQSPALRSGQILDLLRCRLDVDLVETAGPERVRGIDRPLVIIGLVLRRHAFSIP